MISRAAGQVLKLAGLKVWWNGVSEGPATVAVHGALQRITRKTDDEYWNFRRMSRLEESVPGPLLLPQSPLAAWGPRSDEKISQAVKTFIEDHPLVTWVRLFGFSAGAKKAIQAAHQLGRHVQAVVFHSGMRISTSWWDGSSPPILFVSGVHDVTPVGRFTLENYEQFAAAGYDVDLLIQRSRNAWLRRLRETHWWDPALNGYINAWCGGLRL